jgi:hypothetical protein
LLIQFFKFLKWRKSEIAVLEITKVEGGGGVCNLKCGFVTAKDNVELQKTGTHNRTGIFTSLNLIFLTAVAFKGRHKHYKNQYKSFKNT